MQCNCRRVVCSVPFWGPVCLYQRGRLRSRGSSPSDFQARNESQVVILQHHSKDESQDVMLQHSSRPEPAPLDRAHQVQTGDTIIVP